MIATALAEHRVLRAALLLASLLIASLIVPPLARAADIALVQPEPGEQLVIETESGTRYRLDALSETFPRVEREGRDLLLSFPVENSLRLQNWWREDDREHAELWLDEAQLDAAELILLSLLNNGGEGLEATAAGSGSSRGGDFVRSGEGFQTARHLLFDDEQAGAQFGFHSYLLFNNAAPQGPAFERRKAAVEAYFSEVSSLAAMLALEVPEAEINVFWLPIKTVEGGPSKAETQRLASSPQATELIAQLLTDYDFARARALLTRLDLAGDGPWIVSHPKPLSSTASPVQPEQLLVQDLSRAPPALVRRWVLHFKRRLQDDPGRMAARLSGFFLSLRGEIAQLADGLAITREAVAMTLGGEAPSMESAPTSPAMRLADAPPAVEVSEAFAESSAQTLPSARALNGAGNLASRQALGADAAANAWLQARQVWLEARQRAALNQRLLQRRQAWLGRQWRQQALGLQQQWRKDLEALQQQVQQMLEAGVMSAVAGLEVRVALSRVQAREAELQRQSALAALAWQAYGATPPAATGLPNIDAHSLPENAAAAGQLALRWHPSLRLREAELALAQAYRALQQPRPDCQRDLASAPLSLQASCAGPLPELAPQQRLVERARQAAEREGATAWISQHQLGEAVRALSDGVAAAEAQMQAVIQQFSLGQRSLQEVLAAVSSRYTLQQQQVERRAQRLSAVWKLWLANGQLPESTTPADAR